MIQALGQHFLYLYGNLSKHGRVWVRRAKIRRMEWRENVRGDVELVW